jgi:hypothetical protein
MGRRSVVQPSSDTSRIGEQVMHVVPSMLYAGVGTIVACVGVLYKRTYWTVEYRNPAETLLRTDFWSEVLVPASVMDSVDTHR